MADEATGGWVRLARAQARAEIRYFRERPRSFLLWLLPAQLLGMAAAAWGGQLWFGPLDDFDFLACAFLGGMLAALALLALYGVAARNRG